MGARLSEPRRTNAVEKRMKSRTEKRKPTDGNPFVEVVGSARTGDLPLVTVIISLYNYGKFITACLDSVAAQTYQPMDLIVVDDCSKDNSVALVIEWLSEHGGRFTRYRLLRHVKNQGLVGTRNTAFSQVETPYVFVLDADNLLYPRCLDRLVTALQQCDASFSYCYSERFGAADGFLNTTVWDPAKFRGGNKIDAMVLLRRDIWEKIGGYSTNMPPYGWEDFDLWFKIARVKGWGVLVPEILTRYRVHGVSMLNTVTNPHSDIIWAYLRSSYPEFFQDS
jgi:glycosyltransferase involved in cell wall biosynthesis